jgi:hypothetical protein
MIYPEMTVTLKSARGLTYQARVTVAEIIGHRPDGREEIIAGLSVPAFTVVSDGQATAIARRYEVFLNTENSSRWNIGTRWECDSHPIVVMGVFVYVPSLPRRIDYDYVG